MAGFFNNSLLCLVFHNPDSKAADLGSPVSSVCFLFFPSLRIQLSEKKKSVETVVLPDNGFGAPPAGMRHWQIVNTTVRSMGWQNGRTGKAVGREDEEGMGG